MKSRHHFSQSRHGFALLFTLVFLAVMLTIFASMMSWVSSSSTVVERNNQYNMSQSAAEAATERVLAQMMRDFLNQSLTNASYYDALALTPSSETNYDGTPWPVQYSISDASGNTNLISVFPGAVQGVLQPVGSQYANLMGYPWYWTNVATATPIGQPYSIPVTVTQVVNFSSVPIFQYAIFYNLNLEIDPGATMFVNGPVWSNQGLWAGTANLTFNSTVSAVSNAVTSSADPFANGKTDASAPPNFSLARQPTSNNNPLIMPVAGTTNSNPTNVESILNIPPTGYAMGTANAYTASGQEYLANEANLIISNAPWGTNMTAYPARTISPISIWFQDSSRSIALHALTPDFYVLGQRAPTGYYTNFVTSNTADTNRCITNVVYAGWSFVTNVAFYDYRESSTVQAIQIDVSNLTVWLGNTLTNGGSNYNATCGIDFHHTINSIWIYNNVAPSPHNLLPAVRMINGAQLPSAGLTIATPMPIYVYGNYNSQISPSQVSSGTDTANTHPAALMGDAITILSGNWSDSNNSGTALGSRTPSPVTVNAACLEGIVQSVPAIPGNYSGGVENFLRFLENWNRTSTTYNGSIVVMFPSIYATNYWIGPGTYYSAPTRNWGFDFNFTQPDKLPPLTPSLKDTIRVSWAAN
jgi:hypothetical protein